MYASVEDSTPSKSSDKEGDRHHPHFLQEMKTNVNFVKIIIILITNIWNVL
jgi:hypothetical protein